MDQIESEEKNQIRGFSGLLITY